MPRDGTNRENTIQSKHGKEAMGEVGEDEGTQLRAGQKGKASV